MHTSLKGKREFTLRTNGHARERERMYWAVEYNNIIVLYYKQGKEPHEVD